MTSRVTSTSKPRAPVASPSTTDSYTSGSSDMASAILPTMNSSTTESILVPPKKPSATCPSSATSSHTQYFRRKKYDKEEFERITSDQYVGVTESISGSSDTFHCVHGRQGKRYTKKGLLKRNLLKLDAVKTDPQWTSTCEYDMNVVNTLTYLIRQPKNIEMPDRMRHNFKLFITCFKDGYFLLDNAHKTPNYMKEFVGVLENMAKPIRIYFASDVTKYMDDITTFIAYLGYLLMEFEDDKMFDLVSNALLFHLGAPDSQRYKAFHRSHMLIAARQVLVETVVRGMAVSSMHRYPTFLQTALMLILDSEDNCLDFMKENIVETIFYRFNPYFPYRDLPDYDINPLDPWKDMNVVLGASSVHMSTVKSLLLVLLKTINEYIDANPDSRSEFPPPCQYAQRCFVWVYRYECRCSQRLHQRLTLTVIANLLIMVYREQLDIFGAFLMPDVLALSVRTEIYPVVDNWTRHVRFSTSIGDAEFKQLLIHLSVNFIAIFPYNSYMIKSKSWMVGMMYLVDPGLYATRLKWPNTIYMELRKVALQAMVISMRFMPQDLSMELHLIRRLMWYVEWYSESPYELSNLYWTIRVLHVSLFDKNALFQKPPILQLFRSHGIIILMNLCITLLDSKFPPLEICQSVLSVVLLLIGVAVNVEIPGVVNCVVYPSLQWPTSINKLLRKMMNIVVVGLERSYNISDRWLISMLDLIWEAVLWKKPNRDKFLEYNGVFKLLDIVTLTRWPVQCLAMALICDITRTGDAVAQLITWRASYAASTADPVTVKRGATITTLLAKLCMREIASQKIHLDYNNVIQDLDFPFMSSEIRKQVFTPEFAECKTFEKNCCLTAAELAGSIMSKCFGIIQMLSEELEHKVALADETYNLYKNVELDPEVESILVLCSYFLTFKLNAAWLEAHVQTHAYLPQDSEVLDEFLHIGRGWAKHIQQQQMSVIARHKAKAREKESTLYSFLRRVILNTSLDALRDVRCLCRSTDRNHMTHALIFEAVKGYQRRSVVTKKLGNVVATACGPSLDDENLIGQFVKVISIPKKGKPKKRHPEIEGSSSGGSANATARAEKASPNVSAGSLNSNAYEFVAEECKTGNEDISDNSHAANG